MRHLVLGCAVALVAAECSADTVGRWRLDDYPVGTVLKVGDTFRDSVGGRDAVLCAVDPAQADERYLPVVTNGFPAALRWSPAWGSETNLTLKVDHAIYFRGGGVKGYYLRIPDDDGALKVNNLTFEAFARSVNKTFTGAWLSMPAMTDGSWGETNSFVMATSLATWPGFKALRPNASSATGYLYRDDGYNGEAMGAFADDCWYSLAMRVSNGMIECLRDYRNTYFTYSWTHPDATAPFIVGGTVQGTSLEGVLTELRLSDAALGSATYAIATGEGGAHGSVLFHASLDTDFKSAGTDCDGYWNNAKTQVPSGVFEATETDRRYVNPGKKQTPLCAENKGAFLIGNAGTNIQYSVNRSAPLTDLYNFTAECFVRIDSVHDGVNFMSLLGLGHYTGNLDTFRWVIRCTAAGKPYLQYTAPQYYHGTMDTSGANILDGKWHHLALVSKANWETKKVTFSLYVDHVQRGTTTTDWYYTFAQLFDRRLLVNQNQAFDGAVDEVRISCGQLDPQTEMLWQSDYGGALLILR